MRVVAENERLAPPHLCFICEQSPIRDQANGNVVDTQRDFNPPALSHLSGRKYICERCADEAARLLGYIKSDDVDAAQTTLTNARQSIEQLTVYVQTLASEVGDRVGDVLNMLPNAPLLSTPKSENVVAPEQAQDNKEKKSG